MNAIELYLQTAYSDEQLAALDSHIEAGKLSYFSCCCFTGGATADHELQEGNSTYIGDHMRRAMELPYAEDAAAEFLKMGWDAATPDEAEVLRRERIKPYVKFELLRRRDLKAEQAAESLEAVCR